jgi:acyl-homoserine lactone acylase PvdQ
LLPGLPLVVVGRGVDFAWTVTSSQSDNIDTFAETLCGDDRHYLHKGVCREMTTLDAGMLRSASAPDQRLTLLQTVHGVVQGYATVKGRRVALAQQRSTRGREVLSALGVYGLNTGQVTSARSFVRTVSRVEAMFNFFYADDRDIAHVTVGRLPVRSAATDPALPTVGTGEHDWRGFLPVKDHPQTINPTSGAILDWNSKPAAGWGSSDDNWSYGSVQRKELLTAALGLGKRDVTQLVAAANKAATQDLRVMEVWPAISEVLRSAPAPNVRVRTAADMLIAWRASGGSRLDRNLDGKIDHAGAAIMDAAWPLFAGAVLRPVLGNLVERLALLHSASDDPSPVGSAFLDGWYGYVEKDLRTLIGLSVRDEYNARYCGAGNLDSCRESLWSALEQACDILQAEQGLDPTTWRVEAGPERINFTPGLISDTMAWTNRPTFQQVMSFSGHR